MGDGEAFVLDDVLTASSSLEGQPDRNGRAPHGGRARDGHGARNRNLSRKGTTGADGRFLIEGMYPCEYVLEVEGLELAGETRVSVPPRGALVSVGVLSARAPDGGLTAAGQDDAGLWRSGAALCDRSRIPVSLSPAACGHPPMHARLLPAP